jgi:hypothetical protein
MRIKSKGKKLEYGRLNVGLQAALAAAELAIQSRPRLEQSDAPVKSVKEFNHCLCLFRESHGVFPKFSHN